MAYRRPGGATDPAVEEVKVKSEVTEQDGFRTYCVLEFAPKVPAETVEWLVEKITDGRSEGGASLQAQRTKPDEKMVKNVIL